MSTMQHERNADSPEDRPERLIWGVPTDLPDLAALLPSWQRAMRAERKSAATVASYSDGVLAFLRWSKAANVTPEITTTTVQAFTADLLNAGAQAATARTRRLALRRFAAWLAHEGELDSNPLLGIKPSKLDHKIVGALTDDQLRLLIKACAGKELIDCRDEAIVRLMAETGLRAGELIGPAGVRR
jgi:site-specific recombinase XerC